MTWLQRAFGMKAYDANDALSMIVGQMFGTGKKVNSFADAIRESPWVSRAVRTITQTCADVPWTITVNGKPNPALTERLMASSSLLTMTELLERTIAWQALHGYAVWYVELNRITLVDADQVRVSLSPSGETRYEFTKPIAGLNREALVTLPNWTYANVPTGMSDLRSCIDSVNLEESAIELLGHILENGGLLSGILHTDQPLQQAEVDALKKAFEERYGGHEKSGSIGVFGRGLEWQKIGVSPDDFSILDISKSTRQMIAAAFGVPAIYLMDTESVDYANSKTQERIFYQTSVQPRCNRLADRITRFVLPLLGIRGQFVFDWSQVDALQEDKLQRAQVDAARISAGIVAINEIRERDGLPPVAGGEVPLVSAMLVPLGQTAYVPPTPTPEKSIKALHSPEARKLIGNAFLSKTKPEEDKFRRAALRVFGKQGKRIVAWLEGKGMIDMERKDLPGDLLDDEELLDEFRPLYMAFAMSASEEAAARYAFTKIDPKVVRQWIATRGAQISKQINETTNNDVWNIIAEGRAQGQSIQEMVASIESYFSEKGIAGVRAEVIARTNTIGVNNWSATETYKENGVSKHEWLATNDDRTRDTHAEADGQIQPIDEPFQIGGALLMYPGDPEGPAEEVCNCRCTVIPVID